MLKQDHINIFVCKLPALHRSTTSKRKQIRILFTKKSFKKKPSLMKQAHIMNAKVYFEVDTAKRVRADRKGDDTKNKEAIF